MPPPHKGSVILHKRPKRLWLMAFTVSPFFHPCLLINLIVESEERAVFANRGEKFGNTAHPKLWYAPLKERRKGVCHMRTTYSTTAAVDLRRTVRGPDFGSMTIFYRDPNSYPPLRRRIGGTTYIINAKCSPAARETAIEKLLRLMLNDCNRRNKK